MSNMHAIYPLGKKDLKKWREHLTELLDKMKEALWNGLPRMEHAGAIKTPINDIGDRVILTVRMNHTYISDIERIGERKLTLTQCPYCLQEKPASRRKP